MGALMYRVAITMINIFFPPLAVMMLCGLHWDCMLNCILFLCAVIPSHIHGFYISCTYFHRRGKVKKGRYPGGPKSMIHSSKVINGGASNTEVERLYRLQQGLKRKSSTRSTSSPISPSAGREYADRRPQVVERYDSPVPSTRPIKEGSRRDKTMDGRHGAWAPGTRERKWAEGVSRDGYGSPAEPMHLRGSNTSGSRAGRSGWRD